MPRLEWYKWRSGKGLPIHAEWSPTEDIIYIPSDDPRTPPHIAISHEMGHWKGSTGIGEVGTNLGNELNAWEEAIYNLMRAGEWTPEAKEQVTWALRSYVEETGVEDPGRETRWWILRLENRARKRLRKG